MNGVIEAGNTLPLDQFNTKEILFGNLGVGSKKNEGKFTFTVNENLHSLQCTGSLISSNESRRICDERKIPNQEKKECKFKK